MTKLPPCRCCRGPLEPAQQLRFLVETDTLDDPAHLARIRVLPNEHGKPVPVCQACQARLAAPPRRPGAQRLPSLLSALGALSVGLVLTNLFAARG